MPVIAGYDPNPSDNVRVEVAFTTAPDDPDPAWVDLTSRLDLASALMIARGRADEFSVVQPSSCSLTLDNHDGALTAANASSAFYPYVLPHRKIRTSYRDPSSVGNFATTSQASMESGVGDWFSTTGFGAFDVAAISSSTLHPFDGAKDGLATWPTTALGSMAMTTVYGLVIGRTYTVSLYVWVPSGSPDVKLEVPFVASGSLTSTKDAHVRISCTFTATSNSHIVGPRCMSATSGQLCYFDALQVDEGSSVVDFTLDSPPIDYRFTGYVEEWPVEWPNGGRYSQAQITAVDRLSRIGAKMPMKSVIEQALLDDDPVIYFPLGEPEGATKAGEAAGRSGSAPASVVQRGAGGSIEFGTATGPPTDALPAPTFTPASVTNGKFLEARVPSDLGIGSLGFTSSTTLRASFLTSVSAVQSVARLVDSYGSYAEIGINGTGKATATVFEAFSGGVQGITIASASSFADGGTHDAALVLSQSGGTITGTLYIDGVSVGTDSYSATFMPLFVKVRIGGTPSGRCFTGVISHVAAYASGLTLAQVGEHYTATSTGFEGDSSDERIARYARWAGIGDDEMALDAGSSQSICFTDTTGLSVLQAMQDVAQTEGGRLFIDGAGVLTFHARSRMYDNPAASASVDAHLLGSDAQFSMSTQGLVNDLTGQRPTGPSVRAFDEDSIDTYGVFGQSLTLLVTSDAEVADAINWRVQGNSVPQVRIPRGTFDLYTDSTGYQAQLRGLELGDRITLTGLPSQAPASTVDLVLEGYTETIGLTGWTLAANLSNFSTVQALVLDDDVYGLLDGDNRLIY